jgi:hypothetical protein
MKPFILSAGFEKSLNNSSTTHKLFYDTRLEQSISKTKSHKTPNKSNHGLGSLITRASTDTSRDEPTEER